MQFAKVGCGMHVFRNSSSEALPRTLQGTVYKAFVKGMAEVADVVFALLRHRQVPTALVVTEVLSPFACDPGRSIGLEINKHLVSHFFAKGGEASQVLNAVLEEAARVIPRP